MAPKIEVIHDEKLEICEGPHWDHEAKILYYVNIPASTVFKYDPRTNKITQVVVDKKHKEPVGFVVPVAGEKDKFVIGLGQKLALLTWDGVSQDPTSVKTIADIRTGAKVRFNDGKADPQGRLWAGTMDANFDPNGKQIRVGSFYSLSADGKSTKIHLENVGISNGLSWSSDNKTFYYVDSFDMRIDAFDINEEELKNRRTVFSLAKNNITGLPDGMTIDTQDNLWIAVFGGSAVYQVDPQNGSVLQKITLPASKITSVAWGGPNLDELYVSSASIDGDVEGDDYPGRLFKVTGLGASGHPGVPVKLSTF